MGSLHCAQDGLVKSGFRRMDTQEPSSVSSDKDIKRVCVQNKY